MEVAKAYSELPSHSEIKILVAFHFLDNWAGETAYLKANIGPN